MTPWVPASLAGALFATAAALVQQPPVATLVKGLDDKLLPTTTVSGALVAGVMISSGTPRGTADGAWLGIFSSGRTSNICLTAQSADGRYLASEVDYVLPAAPPGTRVVLPFETESKHRAHVSGLDADSLAILAEPGPCKAKHNVDPNAPPAPVEVVALPVTWRDPQSQTQPRKLRVAVITGNRPAKMEWYAPAAKGAPKRSVDCRLLAGRAFTAWCEDELPTLEPTELAVSITPFNAFGRPLDPIKFKILLSR